jgi:hypothetical protein
VNDRPAAGARRLYLAGAVILIAGWVAAALVFVTATGGVDADTVAYRIIGEHAYPVRLGESKRELQKLERLGGKATVWTVEFDDWLGSLWHGGASRTRWRCCRPRSPGRAATSPA